MPLVAHNKLPTFAVLRERGLKPRFLEETAVDEASDSPACARMTSS